MNIQPFNSNAVAGAAKPKAASPARSTQAEVQPDDAQIQRKQQLVDKIKSEPDVRPEVVERAKEIVADTTYPSHELMSRLTKIFLEN